jgi:hypothetical protein
MQNRLHSDALTIRLLDEADLPALNRLSQLDSADLPALPVLGAELCDRLVAAIAIREDGADPLADPFVATAEAVSMLRLRVRQLRDETDGRRHLRLPRLPRRARGALAGSPPGGGSRLLQL